MLSSDPMLLRVLPLRERIASDPAIAPSGS
jgi:hypothetical protein